MSSEKIKNNLNIYWIVLMVVFVLLAILYIWEGFNQPIIIKNFLLPIGMINLAIVIYICCIKKITLKSANIIQKMFLIFLIAVQLIVVLMWELLF
jgi:hypothetical protein